MMISTRRERRNGKIGGMKAMIYNNSSPSNNLEITIPNHFRCPISLDLMKDPVTLSTGITYDRESIEKWVEDGNQICPVTKQVLTSVDQIPNHTIRRMIQDWCVANRSYGIDRIPTPRIPVSPTEVTEMLSKFKTATRRGDQIACLNMLDKIKSLMKESERNRSCIVANRTCAVLSASFEFFATSSIDKNAKILEVILALVTRMFPFDSEAQSYLASPVSLRCMELFLKSGDISRRGNTILILRELVSMDEKHVFALAKIDGVVEPLVRLIKEPICPTSTKASLMVMYYLVSSSAEHKSRFAKMGLVSLLVEILVEAEKSICEKALAVLDEICGSEDGREKAYSHSLTIPVLVKKLLRVSSLATEFAVSAVWKLCKNDKREDKGALLEAMQAGAFQKILLLLQIGCADRTKEKSTELLKLLNLYRGRSECIDSVNLYKGRPF
ncbi:U-box domain-containing protein [Thalictrum thalictroides]|uniref:U-box domain-containing protein n=1 Tax=Thalictrum thalictroides TaxID=46969 RepID=A0A7J6VU67_THATH|nr:U-box domain-containing protein [Thalictrum thalictroides]